MAKTFDNISEASATNYLFLFAQRTLALENESPTPPPLNALGLPCHAIRAMLKLSGWLRGRAAAKEKKTEEEKVAKGERATMTEEAKALPSSPPPSPSSEEVTPGEETPPIEKTALNFAEKITPLAKKVTEYILDHQDDAAQEDRWRTTMKRKMSESFRLQREAAKKQRELIDSQFDRQREEVQSMQQRFDLMHSKLDETIQIVKVIATQSSV